jgi:hypothetical protein
MAFEAGTPTAFTNPFNQGNGVGVWGRAVTTSSYGVVGENTDGIGVKGEAKKGPGIQGLSDLSFGIMGVSDQNRAGVFGVGYRAVLASSSQTKQLTDNPARVQLHLIPVPELDGLPKAGVAGDLLCRMEQETKDSVPEARLWLCVISTTAGVPAQWRPVLLGTAMPGTT